MSRVIANQCSYTELGRSVRTGQDITRLARRVANRVAARLPFRLPCHARTSAR